MNEKTNVGQPEPEITKLRHGPPIVGVGASAGGIDALQRLFAPIEPDCGMAFVVIQHLHPKYKSILPEVLARATRLAVRPIEDGMMVEANTVYVIPPNTTLTIENRRLRLSPLSDTPIPRMPVDGFLISLADDQGEYAAGVILSGTGSDGTQGLRAIKEHGGLTLAQSDAEYDGMMRSAVTSGMVDYLLPADAISAKIAEYFRHLVLIEAKKGGTASRRRRPITLARSAPCCVVGQATTSRTTRTARWSAACSGGCRCCRSTTCRPMSSGCARSQRKSTCCSRTC